MIVLARLLARLTGVALLALIAVAGLMTAVFCLQGGHGTLSLAGLAGDIRLPQLREDIGPFLGRLTAHGSVAVIAAACGLGAVLLGLTLLAGAWVTPRPRRIVLARTAEGTLGTLRRPLSRTLAAQALRSDEIQRVRARARPRRRRDGGRVRVTARAAAGAERRHARAAATAEMTSFCDDLPLRLRVRAQRPPRSQRRRQEVTL